jgi:chemotaxis protein CheX
MDRETAIGIASSMLEAMDMDPVDGLNDMAKATITELANMITGQAVTKLHNLGFKFDLTPPAIFTGDNMEISDQDVEALIVPMEVPQGKIEINVAIRERT